MPKFTIVIPLYNKENYIKNTLQSVIEQTFEDFEILIINDCSTDRSLEKAKRVSDKRIKIIAHEQNKGLSAARNTGIKAAKANYIAFLDADDLWKPTFLEKINFLTEKYPQANLFATNYEVLLENQKTRIYQYKFLQIEKDGIVSNFYEVSRNQSIYNHSCFCLAKKVFNEIGYYAEEISYGEDIDFMIRAHANNTMAYYNEPLSIYRLESENQITQSGINGKILPDYDYYETFFKDRSDIKKYIDFYRYTIAKQYKVSGDSENFQKYFKKIDSSNLTWKQHLLLKLPRAVLIAINRVKQFFLRLGINFTSY